MSVVLQDVGTDDGFPTPEAQDRSDAVCLDASNEHSWFAAVLDHAPVAMYYTDETGRIVYGNVRYREEFRLSEGQDLGEWASAIHVDDRARVEHAWADVCSNPRPVMFEYRLVSADGQYQSCRERVIPVKTARGVRLVGTVSDVSELRGVQNALESAQFSYQTAFEQLPLGVIYVDARGGILYVNAAAANFLGYSPEELLKRTLNDTLDVADAELPSHSLRQKPNIAATPIELERLCEHKNGSLFWARIGMTQVFNPDHTFAHTTVTIEDVSQRKLLELAATREREFAKAVVDNLPLGVIACDADQNLRILNRAARQFLMAPGAVLTGDGLSAAVLKYHLYMPDGTTPLAVEHRPLQRALKGEAVRNAEFVSAAPGRPRRDVAASAAPLVDPVGGMCGAVAVYLDVTERKLHEAAMRALTTQLTAADSRQVFNQAVENLSRLLGLEVVFMGTVPQNNLAKVMILSRWQDGHLRPAVACDLNSQIWGTVDDRIDIVEVHDHADECFPRLKSQDFGPLRGALVARLPGIGGRVAGVIAALSRRPLKKRTHVKAVFELFALKIASELDRYHTQQWQEDLFELAPDGLLTSDSSGVILTANRRTEELFGYIREELIGKKLTALVPDLLIPTVYVQRGSAIDDPRPPQYSESRVDLPARRRDGSVFPAGIMMRPLQYNDDVRIVASVRDLSGRIRAERAARQAFAVLDAIEDAAYVWDAETLRIKYVNTGAVNALGYTSGELLQMTAPELHVDDSTGDLLTTFSPVLSGHTSSVRYTSSHRRKDAKNFPVEVSVHMASPPGESPQLVAIARNISDRVHQLELLRAEVDRRQSVESDLRLAQKLESVGRLASGVAHEINTPIQYIGDSVHFLRSAFEDIGRLLALQSQAVANMDAAAPLRAEIERAAETADLAFLLEEVPRACERTLEGAERVSTIVRAMKEFAHQGSAEKAPADINRALQTTLAIARNEYKYAADVETRFEEIPEVTCNLGELNQVFLNLLVNAAHAVADAGKDAATGKIVIGTHHLDGVVEIYVEDNGCGIPAHLVNRIYDPFFTTKEVGRGSGQGLAITRSIIVDRHGGSINVDSTVGTGTRFTLRLLVGTPTELVS